MKPINQTLIALFVPLLLLSCERVTSPLAGRSKRALTVQEQELVSSDNRFGLKLFQEITASSGDSNIFISPLSVSMALGMTLNGAAGETRAAMESTLELQGLTAQQINESYQSLIQLLTQLDPRVIFRIANSIWYDQNLTFKPEFISLNQQYFDAQVSGLNFCDPNSVNVINQWVNTHTNGRITKIIESIDPQDIMFLINAIYFKGLWTYQFDPEDTFDDLFHPPSGSPLPCRMMQQEGHFPYLETDQFKAVDLPYGFGDFRMAIFLPHPGIDIDAMIAGMDHQTLALWFSSFNGQDGLLEFPRFKLQYELKMNDVLTHLGMGIAFDPELADFTHLYEGPGNAFISAVRHKTFLQVDEEGTEAAAVTSVSIGLTSAGDSFYLHVDRPFLVVLHDTHSHTILFIGKIVEPVWS